MWANKRQHERGAALVEAAVVIGIFMLLVIGTLELAVMYYTWNRTSEAARDALRWAIVNAPVTADGTVPDCPSAAVVVDCASGTCGTLLDRIQARYPLVEAGHVSVRYACSSAGNPNLPPTLQVREIAVTIAGVPQDMMGFADVVSVPTTTVVRTSEDMHTPGS